ncbi:MAG: hypothetical protein PHI98_16360 [Eubacteriales bacterium]|nr:hypothetical protein [Eubacteriales bacterium]
MMNVTMDNLFDAVMAKDAKALLTLFANGEAKIALPSFGIISNNRIFTMLVQKLYNRFSYLGVTARHDRTLTGEGFLISEYTLAYVFHDEEHHCDVIYDTPTALVCEVDAQQKITFMNVYTGFDRFVGKEIVRPAMYNADQKLWNLMPESVKANYESAKKERLTEPCRIFKAGNQLCVEENVLFTEGEICTPQAHLSIFTLDAAGAVAEKRDYGEIVWEFKLWPTLY